MLGDGIVSFGVAVTDDRLQELEVVAEDEPSSFSLPAHAEARGREVDVALVAVEVHR